jgi:hypothetical protein
MRKLLLGVMVVVLGLGLMAPASAEPVWKHLSDFVPCTDGAGRTGDYNMVASAQGLGFTSGPQVRLQRLTIITLCDNNSEAFVEFQHGSLPSTWVFVPNCRNGVPCAGLTFTWGKEKLIHEGIWRMKFTNVLIHTRYAMEQSGMICQDAEYWVARNPHGTYRLGPPNPWLGCSLPT